MNAPDLDPISKLFKGIKTSERMRDIAVELGARQEPPEPSPPRIVIVPQGGALQPPDHSGNVSDFANEVHFDCFAKDLHTLHEVIRRLLCAVDDYTHSVGDNPADTTADGVADCIMWEGEGNIEYDTERDTNRQGWSATVTLTLILSFESTPLAADAGIGTVDSVLIQPA